MEYQEIMWAERRVDFYTRDNCDEEEPEWHCSAEGDMDSETMKSPLILEPETFPPGTRVVVSVPLCPDCGKNSEFCDCGFDWSAWAADEYA